MAAVARACYLGPMVAFPSPRVRDRWIRPVRWALCLVAAGLCLRLSAQLLIRQTTLLGDPAPSGYFGGAVSIDGNRLAVGTSSNRNVYVFERSATGWSLQSRLTASFPGNFE